jgi:hypothetical protein
MIDGALKTGLEAVLGSGVVGAMPVGFGLAGLDITLADGRRLAVKAWHGAARGKPSLEL